MQNYAYDKLVLVNAQNAEKGIDYHCPECNGSVRLREGKVRRAHFYHPKKNITCRLASKGLIHLQLQHHIQTLFPGAILEKPFPEVNRIADIYTSKTVFEIQYSPMSLEEAKARCQDYESLGLQIIWILHDHQFNQKKLRPVETFLRTKMCYYSNMDERGNGIIYDQIRPLNPKPVNLTKQKNLPKFKWPELLKNRAQTWSFYHEGDLFDTALKGLPFPKSTKEKKRLYRAFLHLLLSKIST